MAQATLINVSTELEQPCRRFPSVETVANVTPVSSVKRKADGVEEALSSEKLEERPVTEQNGALPPSKKLKVDDDDAHVQSSEVSASSQEPEVDDAPPTAKPVVTEAQHDDTTSSAFEFERLPAEVRAMVYRILFKKEGAMRPLCHDDRYMEPKGTAEAPDIAPALGLLRTSRMIHSEASAVLYGQNDFILYALDYGDSTNTWLENIGKTNLDALRSVEFDWQHGIKKAHASSKADELFSMVSDPTNPMREALAKMLHDIARSSVLKFATSLGHFTESSRLQHLTLLCPGTDNPGHPDNNCVEYRDCPGCHQELPKAMVKIQNLQSLTVGDADWHNEMEALARLMNAETIHVTQVDCIDMSPESIAEMERQGWSFKITWRDPKGEDFRRVASKRLKGYESRPRSASVGY